MRGVEIGGRGGASSPFLILCVCKPGGGVPTMCLRNKVVLVRSDEARRRMPREITDSAIVLTVFEAKGLEFDDVLLWNFFSDGPADDEWRAVYDYHLKKTERDAASAASAAAVAHPAAAAAARAPLARVDLETSAGAAAAAEKGLGPGAPQPQASLGGKTVRPLAFDAERHKVSPPAAEGTGHHPTSSCATQRHELSSREERSHRNTSAILKINLETSKVASIPGLVVLPVVFLALRLALRPPPPPRCAFAPRCSSRSSRPSTAP